MAFYKKVGSLRLQLINWKPEISDIMCTDVCICVIWFTFRTLSEARVSGCFSCGDGWFTLLIHLAATESTGWLADRTGMPPTASLAGRDCIHDLGLISTAPWSTEWAGRSCVPRLYLPFQAAFYKPGPKREEVELCDYAHEPVTGAGWEQHPYLLESRDMDSLFYLFLDQAGVLFLLKKSHRAWLVLLRG